LIIHLAGMKALLMADPDVEVVGEARDGRTALRLALELMPMSPCWTCRCPA
jgi:DNA-binding NarL/FixJ family response regulator